MEQLFIQLIRKIVALQRVYGFSADENTPFQWANYPFLQKELNKLFELLAFNIENSILISTKDAWQQAEKEQKNLVEFVSKRYYIPKKKLQEFKKFNLEALQSFQKRKESGLSLSDRVWNYTLQYKTELEMALDVALLEGKSASSLASELKQYLKNPDALFRRVADARGVLHLSKKAENYHPGQGVYRSAYKNAERLARTESNMAYHEANFLKIQQFDFVVGVEVVLSNNPTHCPFCSAMAGKYPKDFKFRGWHPQCRCSTRFILKEWAEMGEDIPSKNEVKDLPQPFKDWIIKNEDKINTAKQPPYFLQDNKKFVERVLKQEKIKKVLELPREEQFQTLFESNGGKVLEHLLVNKGKDYESIFISAKEFAKRGKVAEILPELNQRELKEFRKIVFPNYDLNKNPDLRVDGVYHDIKEVEQLHNFIKNANRAIKQGAIPILQYDGNNDFELISKQMNAILKIENYPYRVVYLLHNQKLYKYNKG